jgi:hypothetical protein
MHRALFCGRLLSPRHIVYRRFRYLSNYQTALDEAVRLTCFSSDATEQAKVQGLLRGLGLREMGFRLVRGRSGCSKASRVFLGSLAKTRS